jgi:superfamily I DNA/RNA helicase
LETGDPGERLFALADLYGDLREFLDTLTVSGVSGNGAPEPPREGVRVMTIHGSKGLEFDHVFIPALEEGLLPFTLYEKPGAIQGEGIEEEGRLLYVAMTRARTGLYLSRAESRTLKGRQVKLPPSRFLRDLESLIPQAEPLRQKPRDPQPRLF